MTPGEPLSGQRRQSGARSEHGEAAGSEGREVYTDVPDPARATENQAVRRLSPRPLQVDLIGAGRLGSALAAWLSAPRPPRLQTVVSRRAARARALARRWAAPAISTVAEYAPGAPLVLLAVPDDALEDLARQLGQHAGWRGKIVLHTSGLQPAAVLAPLRRRGAAIGSLHPLMTFAARRPAPSPAGIVFALEGQETAVRAAQRLVADWGGRSLRLHAREKPLYHLAATWASPFVVVNFAVAAAVLRRAGLRGRRLALARTGLARLLAETAANLTAVAPHGELQPAWTGPIARGDRHTIRQHLTAAGEWASLYRAMAREAGRRL